MQKTAEQMLVEVQETALNHTRLSHAALDAAKQAMDKQAAIEKKCDELIPSVADALINNKRLDSRITRDDVVAALRDPVRVLDILKLAADPTVMGDQPQVLGSPVGGGSAPVTRQVKNASLAFDHRGNDTAADARYASRILALGNHQG